LQFRTRILIHFCHDVIFDEFTEVDFSSILACADFDMFRPVILIVLFLGVYVHVDDLLVFDNLKSAEVFVRDAAVLKMTVCVTFFAVRVGPTNRPLCARSDYVTFSTIAATAVRGMTMCVTFGAPHLRVFVATWGHPTVDQIGGVLLRTRFRHLRS